MAYADVVLDTLEKEFKKDCYLTAEEEQEINSQAQDERHRNQLIKVLKANQKKLIDYRLYRDNCIRTPEGIYIKDLRILKNRNFADLLIVDNAVYSFGYQLDNGIPIIPFYDSVQNKNDEELMHLIYYFKCIAESEDVRIQNNKAFQLKDLQQLDIVKQLKAMQESSQNANNYEEQDVVEADQNNGQVSEFNVNRDDHQQERDTPFGSSHMRMNTQSIGGGNSNGTIPEEENEDSHNPNN